MDDLFEIFESAGSCLIAAAVGLVVLALIACCAGAIFLLFFN